MERNWRYNKSEIDIIGKLKDEIVFFEVKTRSSKAALDSNKALSTAQEKRIIQAANSYIQLFEIDLEVRFDVLAITNDQNSLTLEHIKNAFFPTID